MLPEINENVVRIRQYWYFCFWKTINMTKTYLLIHKTLHPTTLVIKRCCPFSHPCLNSNLFFISSVLMLYESLISTMGSSSKRRCHYELLRRVSLTSALVLYFLEIEIVPMPWKVACLIRRQNLRVGNDETRWRLL